MNKLLYLAICMPLLTQAQDNGIKFVEGLSWQRIKEKAKIENKFIFLDCYATWCKPCKEMDKKVYPNEKVGTYLNDKFISVKVQMDSSKLDNEQVKNWYADAHSLQQEYKVTTVPSYLFFTSDGKIAHKDIGFKKVDDFILLVSNVSNPDKQYFTLLENYQQGKLDYKMMASLSNISKKLGDKHIAYTVAKDYINNYLMKLNNKTLYTKVNIEFLGSFIQNSTDIHFNLFYHNAKKINKIIGRSGYAQGYIDYVITKEEIDSKLWSNNNTYNYILNYPDWNKITSSIKKKYNRSYAERNVLNAQIRWYSLKNDWPKVIKYNINKIEKYGLDTAGLGWFYTNNMIWSAIFKHSTERTAINKAIRWMEIIIKAHPNDAALIDTYANLLYKIGRKQEAITWEEKVLKLEEEDAVNHKRVPDKIYQETLDKMKKGIPTWPTE